MKEYWIIDRFRRSLTVYSWHRRRWAKKVHPEKEIYVTPLLPGFELPLARLFAVADKYD